jgi:amidase
MAMAPTFDTIGWFATGPGVFRRVGAVLLDGAAGAAPLRRLLVADDAFAEADAAVARLCSEALAAMAGVLPEAERVRVAPGGLDAWREAVRVLQAFELWGVYGGFITARKPRFGPGVAERMQIAAGVTAAQAEAARAAVATARQHLRYLVAPGTIVALPSAPCIAPRTDANADALESYRVRVMRLTGIAGVGGLPQVSLPIGIVDGCPVGLSFIAWADGDEALLDLAAHLARFCGRVG